MEYNSNILESELGQFLVGHLSNDLLIDGDGSGVGLIDTGYEVEECGFTRSARSHNGEGLAMGDME